MSLPLLLAAFGIRQPLVIEREFVTPLGAPKAVVRSDAGGERWFVGSVVATWPGVGHIDAMVPLLNQVSRSLTAARSDVTLGRYLRTHTGSHVVRWSGYHLFVRQYFTGGSAEAPGWRHPRARALGTFHEYGWAALRAAGRQNPRSIDHAALYPQWILPQLLAARSTGLGAAAGPTRECLARLAERAARHAAELDRLPVFLTHADYQGKNIVALADAHAGRPRIAIIDTETAQLQSRLFDFYFLLMGDDCGAALGDFAAFRSLLASYFEHAPALNDDEARLLGFALQTKAATIAAWVAAEYDGAAPERQSVYRTWFAQALRCIQFIDEHADAIRDMAEAHRAAMVPREKKGLGSNFERDPFSSQR